ncbi:MAG: hypothetical protein OEW69_11900, partial [Nitrospirota bacterium]|nr:hypothetical protein [Nitrospirota bacterium]
NVYVVDYRIQKFNNNGGFITKWGSCCVGDGYFNSPWGVAVDSSGNVYVADSGNHRIQKFNSNGGFITKWGSYGLAWGPNEENGNFNGPWSVAVDSSLNVFVADMGNDRIQKFKPVSPQPSEPTNLTATTVSRNQINLSWTDNSYNESGFVIKRKYGVGGTYYQIATVGANVPTFSDTNVNESGTYYYAVWAYNSAGDSAYSNEASAITLTPPVPDIKANGSDSSLYVRFFEPVDITISLDPGGYSGVNADWGGAKYVASEGILYWYNFSTGQWTTYVIPAYQGPLFNLSPTSIIYTTLPPDTYTFYFGVDLKMNGLLDEPFYYDSVDVISY